MGQQHSDARLAHGVEKAFGADATLVCADWSPPLPAFHAPMPRVVLVPELRQAAFGPGRHDGVQRLEDGAQAPDSTGGLHASPSRGTAY